MLISPRSAMDSDDAEGAELPPVDAKNIAGAGGGGGDRVHGEANGSKRTVFKNIRRTRKELKETAGLIAGPPVEAAAPLHTPRPPALFASEHLAFQSTTPFINTVHHNSCASTPGTTPPSAHKGADGDRVVPVNPHGWVPLGTSTVVSRSGLRGACLCIISLCPVPVVPCSSLALRVRARGQNLGPGRSVGLPPPSLRLSSRALHPARELFA